MTSLRPPWPYDVAGDAVGGLPGMAEQAEQEGADAAPVAEGMRRRAVVAGALFIASLVVVVAVLAWNDHRVRRASGERLLVAVAEGRAGELELTLDNFGRAFRGVAGDVAALERDAPAAAAMLSEQAVQGVLARHPGLLDLSITAERPPLPAQAADPRALGIGSPMRAGTRGPWVLPLVMAMPPGRDGGPRWLVGRLKVDALSAIVDAHDLGPSGVTAIAHRDGRLIASSLGGSRYLGADMSKLELFRQLSSAGAPRGSVETRSSLVGPEPRIIGYAALRDYPLVVTAGSRRAHVLAGWNAFVAALAAGSLLLVLAWLFGLWMLRRSGRRERELQRSVAQSAHALDALRGRVREVETQYRFLYERFPLPACVFDRDSLEILEVNEAAVAQYGYTREGFLALSPADLLAEDSADDVRQALATSPEVRGDRVWKHVRRDGSTILAAIFASDVLFLGRPARLVIALDVTDRERAEAERARTEARFQMVTRATSDAVWDWDIATGDLWWNEGFNAHYGWDWTRDAANVTQWLELVHPEDRARTKASLEDLLAGSAHDWHASYRLRRADGSYADVEDRGLVLRDQAGKAIRAVGGMLDVTRQRRDEADLRLLRRAVESTENGIVIFDAQAPGQPVVYANPAFERITGYRAAEALGTGYQRVLGDGGDGEVHGRLLRAVAEARDVRMQLRSTRRDGVAFWNELRMTPVRDGHGALTHFVAIVNDISDRKRAEEALAHRATHDALTGLPNRELLQERLDAVIHGHEGDVLGVAVLDLDDFKLINDSLGHAVGDEVLVTVSRRLAASAGEGELVARIGGDEFIVVLRCPDDAAVASRLEGLLSVLAQPVEVHGAALQVTPSLGWCRFPGDGDDALALMRRADQAMYQAKRQGRNCVVAYRSEFDEGASQRLDLVLQLREALQAGQFMLVFQPQFDRGNQPVGLEALLRWNHPTRGLLAPAHFIAACEDSGLIVPIGRWVLREAARHHHLLAARGWERLRIAVNVSAAQFQQDLAADVAAVLRDHGLPRDVLELELTESVVMANPDAAIRSMADISALGVQIAIDDFGTGYSSLAYLKRLPLHRLKLDRSFVRDLGRDPDDEAICGAIIRLAQSLELKTTAEGVETETQWRWLRERGCDEMQGFLLAKPAPFEETLARLGAPRAGG